MDRCASFAIWKDVLISDCTQICDAVSDAKHSRHEEALSGVKASRARLMKEAESRKEEVKTLLHDAIASSLEAEPASALKLNYGLAAPTALQKVQQELDTKELEQWVRSELENTELREKLDILEKTSKEEDKQKPKKWGLKLNVISEKTFGMT